MGEWVKVGVGEVWGSEVGKVEVRGWRVWRKLGRGLAVAAKPDWAGRTAS